MRDDKDLADFLGSQEDDGFFNIYVVHENTLFKRKGSETRVLGSSSSNMHADLGNKNIGPPLHPYPTIGLSAEDDQFQSPQPPKKITSAHKKYSFQETRFESKTPSATKPSLKKSTENLCETHVNDIGSFEDNDSTDSDVELTDEDYEDKSYDDLFSKNVDLDINERVTRSLGVIGSDNLDRALVLLGENNDVHGGSETDNDIIVDSDEVLDELEEELHNLGSVANAVTFMHERDEFVTYMSDRKKGLLDAFKSVVPNAETRFCCRHIWDNFRKQFLSEAYRQEFWKAARASTKGLDEPQLESDKDDGIDHENQDELHNILRDFYPEYNNGSSPIDVNNVEEPNADTKKFYSLLKDSQDPVYEGCKSSRMSALLKLLHIKTLGRWKKRTLCNFLKELKVPDGFSSNISYCVNSKEAKISGLKSHDYHVILEHLLPVAMRGLLTPLVREALIEMSRYMQNIETRFNRLEQNYENANGDDEALPIFSHPGRGLGAPTVIDVPKSELDQAHNYILKNCDEVQPFLENIMVVPNGSTQRASMLRSKREYVPPLMLSKGRGKGLAGLYPNKSNANANVDGIGASTGPLSSNKRPFTHDRPPTTSPNADRNVRASFNPLVTPCAQFNDQDMLYQEGYETLDGLDNELNFQVDGNDNGTEEPTTFQGDARGGDQSTTKKQAANAKREEETNVKRLLD
uniref:Uncharacterized protein n=1 Tax=Chenopodium quinoa TaxID=63459 RepID=A0A803N9M9_CHEQI